MRDATIITLYKNKGDRLGCNSYGGISLMSIVGKIFACVLLTRLQALVDRIYPEFQCGFRAERSTDMIFTVRQLQKKSHEQGKPLYLAFSDLSKAFDSLSIRPSYGARGEEIFFFLFRFHFSPFPQKRLILRLGV